MENYRIGDFILISNLEIYEIDTYLKTNNNIFEITDIKSDFIKVRYSNSKIHLSDVNPIPINGKDDLKIYYDPIVAASLISHNDTVPVRKKDYTYYYEAFKNSIYMNKNYQELVEEQKFQFVHEIQHFLIDEFNDHGLKINH